MFRACCHHYPGGIAGCVSRSLHRRRRPSPLEWRVGSHIDDFEACSMFTHVAARTVRCPSIGAFSRSASGHSSPPDPPRVLPAGARVCRPGFPPGRAVHLGKAHITRFSNATSGLFGHCDACAVIHESRIGLENAHSPALLRRPRPRRPRAGHAAARLRRRPSPLGTRRPHMEQIHRELGHGPLDGVTGWHQASLVPARYPI